MQLARPPRCSQYLPRKRVCWLFDAYVSQNKGFDLDCRTLINVSEMQQGLLPQLFRVSHLDPLLLHRLLLLSSFQFLVVI